MNKNKVRAKMLVASTMLLGAMVVSVTVSTGSYVLAGPTTQEAKMHFEEGIKALQSGDSNGAMTHLKIADQALMK